MAGVERRAAQVSPALALVLALSAVTLGSSCYNPEIRDGGFLCDQNGVCPQGFTCVQEGARRICRGEGAATSDSAITDAVSDAPADVAHDAAIDATPDAALDATPDAALDATLDAKPTPDAKPGLDAKSDGPSTGPDLGVDGPPPTPDSYTTGCNKTDELVSAKLLLLDNGYDLAVDSSGDAHAVYAEQQSPGVGLLKHRLIGGTAPPDGPPAGVSVSALGADVDSAGRLIVLYINSNGYYVASRGPTGLWDKSSQLNAGGWTSADLDMVGAVLYGAVTGTIGSLSFVSPVKATRNTGGTFIRDTCSSLTGSGYGFARLVATATTKAFTFYDATAGSTGLWIAELKSCAVTPTPTQIATVTTPAPLAVAVTSKGTFHMAWVAATGAVQHTVWSGGTSQPITTQITATNSEPMSVDIALDHTDNPHVVYRTSGGSGGLHWARWDGSKWQPEKISSADNSEARIRLSGKTIHVLYEDSVTQRLLYSCRTF